MSIGTLQVRTWPYGTQYQVVILQASKMRTSTMLLCMHADEAFVLVLPHTHDAARSAKENDVGVITFKEGGPTGGYWDYEAEGDNGDN